MATTMNLVCVVFLCSLIVGGNCQPCTEQNLKITQSKTGKMVQNKPEWNVKITNVCPCSQLDVKLSCDAFQTVEDIDSSILRKSGSECLVNNGQPIYPNTDFNFNYAWDNSFSFKPVHSQVGCS
ncbi:unnamed protein product [Prunus brigantina]